MADSNETPAGAPVEHSGAAATGAGYNAGAGAGAGAGGESALHVLEMRVQEFFSADAKATQRAAAQVWGADTLLKDLLRPDKVTNRATKKLPPGHPMRLIAKRNTAIQNLGTAVDSMPGRGGSVHDVAEFIAIARINGGRGGGTADVPISALHRAFRLVADAQARVHARMNLDLHTQKAFRHASLVFNETLAEFYSVETGGSSGTRRTDPVFQALCALLDAHQAWRHPGEPPRLKAELLSSASVPDITLMAAGLDPTDDTDERTNTPLSLVELKNERGVSGDPDVQNLSYYADEVFADEDLRPFPMLLVSMAGAEIHYHGAIVRSESYVGELMCATASCHPRSEDAAHLAYLYARWFDACELIRDDVEAVWASLPRSEPAKLRARLFPDMEWPSDDAAWQTTEAHPTSGRINFVQHIARGAFRATMLERSVIVKFCTRNATATQQKCANASTAARVLCDTCVVPARSALAVAGTDSVAWRMVVMEDLEYQGFVQFGSVRNQYSAAELLAVQNGVQSALDIVHAEDQVFCDLRPPNVMVRKAATTAPPAADAPPAVVDVRLIDFEFCGPTGTPWPAVELKKDVDWPFDIASTANPIRDPAQDATMLRRLVRVETKGQRKEIHLKAR